MAAAFFSFEVNENRADFFHSRRERLTQLHPVRLAVSHRRTLYTCELIRPHTLTNTYSIVMNIPLLTLFLIGLCPQFRLYGIKFTTLDESFAFLDDNNCFLNRIQRKTPNLFTTNCEYFRKYD